MEYPSIRRAKEKLATSRAPRIQFCVRFYGDELIEVKKRARMLGKSVSAYVRDCCLGEFVSDVFTEQVIDSDSSLQENSSANSIPISRQSKSKADPIESTSNGKAVESFQENHAQDGPKKKEIAREKVLEIISRKTGHQKFCNCFACERLGAILKDAKA